MKSAVNLDRKRERELVYSRGPKLPLWEKKKKKIGNIFKHKDTKKSFKIFQTPVCKNFIKTSFNIL